MKPAAPSASGPPLPGGSTWLTPRRAMLLVGVMAAALYANTLGHGFALDDPIVYTQNRYVQQGLAGVPALLTTDSFEGMFGSASQGLPGGRYRPLSLISFALEVELTGGSPGPAHAINVLMYALLCGGVFRFVWQWLFARQVVPALLAALVFAAHPLHTEVVANIKGRDDLLALLFTLLAVHHGLRWWQQAPRPPIPWALLATGSLAALSKESGLLWVVFLPLMGWFGLRMPLPQLLRQSWPLAAVTAAYALWRSLGVAAPQPGETVPDVYNQPYLLAEPLQALASQAWVLAWGLWRLLWPWPMANDWGYDSLPLRSPTSPSALLALLVLALLLAVAALGFRRRAAASGLVLAWWAGVLLYSNLFINIGAAYADRFLLLASLPFAVAAAGARQHVSARWKPAATGALLLLVALHAGMTLRRTPDWENDDRLFAADVKHTPNNAKAHKAAAERLLGQCRSQQSCTPTQALQAQQHLHTALALLSPTRHNNRVLSRKTLYDIYHNLGSLAFYATQPDSARHYWAQADSLWPQGPYRAEHPRLLGQLHHTRALQLGEARQWTLAVREAQLALKFAPDEAAWWYTLGRLLWETRDLAACEAAWLRATQLAPRQSLYWNSLGGVRITRGNAAGALPAFEKAVELNPNDAQARQAVQALKGAAAGGR